MAIEMSLMAVVRRHDPDRYFTTLFAPRAAQEALFTLYAFNHELARAPEVASEPGLALIRLQWWREVVEGAARPHVVAGPLHQAIADGVLAAPDLLEMIEARELEAEGDMPGMAAFRGWALQGPGSLAVAAGRALGASRTVLDRLRRLGAGIGMSGQLRNVAAFAAQGRCLLPADLVAEHGLGAPPVLQAVAEAARAMLGAPGSGLGQAVAAGLPAVLARRDLRRGLGVAHPRGLGDRLAVTAAALLGRV